MNNNNSDKKYTQDDIKNILSKVIDNDLLVMYTTEDIQRIFHFDSIVTARQLMNHPKFPSMKIGKRLLVTKKALKAFISENETSQIHLS